ncbi:MAG: hypothetical protein KDA75_12595, partial [Planctomycetaceae bacterium]|nr:hypothetical protein [Planctomycetaceae bacterium]
GRERLTTFGPAIAPRHLCPSWAHVADAVGCSVMSMTTGMAPLLVTLPALPRRQQHAATFYTTVGCNSAPGGVDAGGLGAEIAARKSEENLGRRLPRRPFPWQLLHRVAAANLPPASGAKLTRSRSSPMAISLLRPVFRLVRRICNTPLKRRRPAPVYQNVEVLEDRRLPAAALTATLSGGVLKVEGTEKADTIRVRQSNGLTGTTISVDGIKINVSGKAVSSVNFYSVTKIEVRALGGDDYINLHVSDYEAVSIKSTVWGHAGNDRIYGGNGNDTLYGNAGSDKLYGYSGDDFLSGGTAGVSGATLAEKDLFWGGTGFDKYSDGFDFKKWVYNGQSASDINQEGSPTCQTLATLASAVTAGIDFAGSKITYLGNYVYNVKLYEAGKAVYEKVTFDGTWSDNDPAPRVDSNGYSTPEFWTILMQRARLEHFYNINWSTKMTDAAWDAANTKYGGLYSVQKAIQQMHGWKTGAKASSGVSGQWIKDALAAKKVVILSTPGDKKKADRTPSGLVTGHAYAVVSAFQQNGVWKVKVYNPWGTDGTLTNNSKTTAKDGTDDGYITLTLSEVQNPRNSDYIYTGWKA